jgi:NAD(P)-dependent dehydrogenase (short-subunit alcohol dehydrogenase family)
VTSLDQRVAIITGASSGIGRATALALAAAGTSVALAARREPELAEAARAIEARGGRAFVVPTDVTDRGQIEELVEKTLAQWGRLDVVVANAGVYVRSPFVDVTTEYLERSMAVNFYGAVHLVLAALPHLLEQRSGHIVLVVSVDGKKGLPLDAPYAAAKFALAGFGDVARQELRPSGINVSTILPGRVDTPLIDEYRFPLISKPIKPERVARAILRAIEKNQAEVVVPASNAPLIWAQTISPRLADWGVRTFKLEGWRRS